MATATDHRSRSHRLAASPHRRSALSAAMALLAIAAIGCGAPGQIQPTRPEKTVVIAYPVDIEGVNELVNQSTALHNTLNYFALFVPLLEESADYQDGNAKFNPRLASSYEFSPDRLELTFFLNPDAFWSDGVPVTAEDVQWTWELQNDPRIAWPFANGKSRISNVEAIDTHTVRFHFTEAYASQLHDANLGVPLPKHAWSRLPIEDWLSNSDWFIDNLVVNGPFTLESWEPQQRVILRRNPSYFEPGLPKVDRVVFEVVREAQSRFAMLRSGKAHIVEFVSPSEAEAVVEDPNLRLETFIPRFFYFLMWNTSRSLFADTEVRQALTMAIDRQAIIDTLHYGYANISYSPFQSNTWVHNKNLQPWPFAPGKAREILAARGWVDRDGDGILDRDGVPFQFELLTNSENSLRRDITVMIQEQLRRIGVAAEARHMEFNSMLAPLSRHEFDAVVSGLAMDTSFDTSYYFHTNAIDDGYNWGAYSNAEIDQLIEKIAKNLDASTSKPLFDRLQEILHEELPITFLYEGIRLCAIRQELQDVRPNAVNSFYNLRFWRLEEEEAPQ